MKNWGEKQNKTKQNKTKQNNQEIKQQTNKQYFCIRPSIRNR